MNSPQRPPGEDPYELGVSIVVCCFNSVDRLPRTLEHLARQRVPQGLRWEVIVVDNASTDGTAATAEQTWADLASPVPFRVVPQPVAGLSAAREKGTDEARHGLIVFCDDDNWLDEHYVRTAFDAMVDQPRIGVVGGRGTPAIEGEAPPWFEQYARYFALGPQGTTSGDVAAGKGYVYGAGFVVRRSALDALRQRGFVSQLTGRKGTSLSSSEDRELCYALRLIGYEIHYVEGLRFQHEIPERRLRWSYFLEMVEMASRTTPFMDAYRDALGGVERRPPSAYRQAARRRRMELVLEALRRPRTLLAPLQPNRVSANAVKWRRWRGAWTGWRAVEATYDQVCAAVYALREGRKTP